MQKDVGINSPASVNWKSILLGQCLQITIVLCTIRLLVRKYCVDSKLL
jgi:hypothetical protein